MEKMNYYVFPDKDGFGIDVIMQDGGMAYAYHNGEHLILNFYQSRIPNNLSESEDSLMDALTDVQSESKMYCKDLPDKQKFDDEVIDELVDWLCPGINGIELNRINMNVELDEHSIKTLLPLLDFNAE